ncbi:MAG: type II toxin-antitoxin system VapC family toxin [Bryobacter sp.]
MSFLLDTCVVSDLTRGKYPILDRNIRAVSTEEVAISTVTVYEIHFGLANSLLRGKPPTNPILRLSRHVIQTMRQIPFDEASARTSGELRAELNRLGTPIGPYDLLLAGTAMAHGLTFVTRNRKVFSRIQGLQLADWYRG